MTIKRVSTYTAADIAAFKTVSFIVLKETPVKRSTKNIPNNTAWAPAKPTTVQIVRRIAFPK
jgi:hypothetical protein